MRPEAPPGWFLSLRLPFPLAFDFPVGDATNNFEKIACSRG